MPALHSLETGVLPCTAVTRSVRGHTVGSTHANHHAAAWPVKPPSSYGSFLSPRNPAESAYAFERPSSGPGGGCALWRPESAHGAGQGLAPVRR